MSTPYDKFLVELAKHPTLWQPSPKDLSDALAASYNWDMKRLSMHNLRTLRVAAGLWLEHIMHDNDQCPICGDDHQGAVPLGCETGDGV